MGHLKPKIAESRSTTKEIVSTILSMTFWGFIAVGLFFFPIIAVMAFFSGRG